MGLSLINEEQTLGIAVDLRNFLLHYIEILLTNNAGAKSVVLICMLYGALIVTKKE